VIYYSQHWKNGKEAKAGEGTVYSHRYKSAILYTACRFLDAGTGVHSLLWIQKLNTTAWSAITADYGMQRSIESTNGLIVRPQDEVLVGNWMDDNFCANLGQFDTILADYLIGAVDGFSPYAQDVILKRCFACQFLRRRVIVIVA
jgi:hypothetical protein